MDRHFNQTCNTCKGFHCLACFNCELAERLERVMADTYSCYYCFKDLPYKCYVKGDSMADIQELRDILGCTCSYAEKYDGLAWNLKTEKHQDCECVGKLKDLEQLIKEKLILELESLREYYDKHELILPKLESRIAELEGKK